MEHDVNVNNGEHRQGRIAMPPNVDTTIRTHKLGLGRSYLPVFLQKVCPIPGVLDRIVTFLHPIDDVVPSRHGSIKRGESILYLRAMY